jgi:hypothetical protein
MDAPIYVSTPAVVLPPAPPAGPDLGDLLRQALEVQKEQLAVLKAQAAAQDAHARWRAFLTRWQGDFPEIGSACRQVLPVIERAYLGMIQELTDRLRGEDGGLDNEFLLGEFLLGEFLDRYGMRLGQLGTILSQLGPLADAAPVESSGQ